MGDEETEKAEETEETEKAEETEETEKAEETEEAEKAGEVTSERPQDHATAWQALRASGRDITDFTGFTGFSFLRTPARNQT